MESLSIKKTGKVFLAVALVIFMLVALLGLAVFTTTTASASAEAVTTITAAFSGSSATAHGDSTTTKKYYNQLAEGDGACPLAVNDTFDVTYSFAIGSGSISGLQLTLERAGFQIIGVAVNGVAVENHTATVNSIVYTFNGTNDGYVVIDRPGTLINSSRTPAAITVTYKLTSAISTYSHADLYIGGIFGGDANKGTFEVNSRGVRTTLESNAVGVYVRSTATITNAAPGKTYDATAVSNVPTFTPAVDDTSTIANRAAISVQWKAAAGEYGNVAPIDAGSYYVKSSTPANDYYEATMDEDAFTIAQRAVTITADNKTSVYSQAKQTLTYTYSESGAWSAFADRDSITVSYSGAGASIQSVGAGDGSNTAVGSYTITPSATGTGIGNYAVTAVNGTYTVTRMWIAVPTVTVVNGESSTTLTAGGSTDVNYNGVAYGFNVAAATDNAYSVTKTDDSKNVGTYELTLTIGSNYRWGAQADAEDLADKVFTYVVKKVDLHVSLDHAAITYRDAVPTSGYSISLPTAAVGGETVDGISLTQSDFATAYEQYDVVGTYAITLDADSATDTAIRTAFSNYNVIYDTAAKLTVNKYALSADAGWITWRAGDSASMTYDAAAHGIQAVNTAYLFGSTEVCSVGLSGGDNSNGTQTHVSGDEAAVTLTATFALKTSTDDDQGNSITDNYSLDNKVVTKDITITRKAITVTANPKTITYGDAFANDGVTYGTFAGEETSAVLTGTLAYATDYVAEAENAKRVVGTYYIRPSGLSNNDYAISFVDGTLTVSKKTVSITWSETKSWVYDANSHTITATIGATAYSESITVTEYGDDASGTNVGDYTRSVTTLSDMANYALPADVDEDYSITAKPITVTVAAPSGLIYNSNDQVVFTVTVAGLIGEQDLTFAYTNTNLSGSSFKTANGTIEFEGELAQSYAILVTAISDGDDGLAANYSFTPDAESTTNSIAKYTFTWAAVSYSGNVATWTAPTTIQDGDSITFAYSLKLGGVEKLASNTALTYTATETGVYTLSVTFTGDRAANYNAIADKTLLEVFSVTLNDAAHDNATYGHPHNGAQHAAVVQYAFDGQTVADEADWTVDGYVFEDWYSDVATPDGAFDYTAAVTASATYTARYHVAIYKVTYKYKLSGAAEWETWKSNVDTYYYTALQTVPTITWFANDGWKDGEGVSKTTLDVTSAITYYTVYTFNVKNGDMDGNGTIDASDATLYRQVIAGGYAIDSGVQDTIADAWATADQFTEGVYSFSFTANTYFLMPVADVDGSGATDVNDLSWIVASTINDNEYNVGQDESGVYYNLQAAEITSDTVVSGIFANPSLVTVAGEEADYSYDGDAKTLTLTTALASGKQLVIVVNGVKYKYTKA